MKRKTSSEVPSDIKRLRSSFETAPFPDIPETDDWDSWSTVNLLPWARTHDPDIMVSNGSIEFQAHKRVLKSISSVFNDLIQGDSMIEVITLQVNNFALEQLEKIIYDFDPAEFWSLLKTEIRKSPKDSIYNMGLLSCKYDVKRLYTYFRDLVLGADSLGMDEDDYGLGMDMDIWCNLKAEVCTLSQLGMPAEALGGLDDKSIIVGEESEDAFLRVPAEIALECMLKFVKQSKDQQSAHQRRSLRQGARKGVGIGFDETIMKILQKYEAEKIKTVNLRDRSVIERSFSMFLDTILTMSNHNII